MPSSVSDSHTEATTSIPVIRVVVGIVLKDKQVLISRRQAGQHLAGLWEFPGGKMESGETAIQTLERELKEEVGIVPIEPQLFLQHSHDYEDRKVFLDFWLVEEFSGNARGKEFQALRWVDLPELKNYAFPVANNIVLTKLVRLER